MSSILSSQGLVIATAMVVSSTALFLAFSKHDKISHHKTPRSCLSSSSGERKKETKNKNKKKKKVSFAEGVKEPSGNGERYRRERKVAMAERRSNGCGNEIPANRVALYNGILKERLHRMELECSF